MKSISWGNNRIRAAAIAGGIACVSLSLIGVVIFNPGRELIPGEIVVSPLTQEWSSPAKVTKAADNVVKYLIKNNGERPVTIQKLRYSCGCVKATVNPQILSPFGTAELLVQPTTLLAGERNVGFTLETDSPVTPAVFARLIIHGSRKPPYLVHVQGDLGNLSYSESGNANSSRSFTIETVELSGSPQMAFEPRCGLDCLRIEPGEVTERSEKSSSSYLSRTYNYSVRVAAVPRDQVFVGEIQVVDPWESNRVLTLRAYGKQEQRIQAMPERIVLNVGHASADRPSARLVIRTNERPETLHLETEPDKEAPFTIERLPNSGQSNLTAFLIRYAENKPPVDGIYSIKAYLDSDQAKSILIPVMVRGESRTP